MFVRSHPRGFATVAVMLAVTAAESGGDGWESNPPRTPQQRPANGFEDRGRHQSSFIPSLASLYFGCQPDKQGCDPSRHSTALSETTPHVFEDRGEHQLPYIPGAFAKE